MQRLFLFLFQYRAFLTFLFLEILCAWLIVQHNSFQGAKYFNSSNRIASKLLQTSTGVTDFFGLAEVNKDLAKENASLHHELWQLKQSLYDLDVREIKDAEIINQYYFTSAKVIKNSIRHSHNYITINKGSIEGIEPGMGVLDNRGVVGIVKSVTRHFSVITSLLHGDMLLSSRIARTGDLCTTSWDTIDPLKAAVDDIPLHVNLEIGDSIITSGNSAVFPGGLFVGKIGRFNVVEGSGFYDVDMDLAVDFNALSYVYLVKNNLKPQLDSLQVEIGDLYE